nr:hypothetical transcript [Hymenolepis microstoma]
MDMTAEVVNEQNNVRVSSCLRRIAKSKKFQSLVSPYLKNDYFLPFLLGLTAILIAELPDVYGVQMLQTSLLTVFEDG